MKLLPQLRDDIVDPRTPASVVLRKAKILAASLSYPEFATWLANELSGYTNIASLPSYRILKPPVLGTFSGPFGQMVSDYGIPVSLLPDFMQDSFQNLPMAHPLREIEAMASSSVEVLRHNLPTEATILARDSVRLSGGFILVEMHQPISRAVLEGIVDAVRTRFLDFLLGLQGIDKSILESETAISHLPKDQVAKTFNVTIMGNNNVVAAHSTLGDVQIQAIAHGSIQSLGEFMKSIGVANLDISSLSEAIKADGDVKPEALGSRVTNWIGAMVGKAVSGTWNVALSAAPELLKEAIWRYYGWK